MKRYTEYHAGVAVIKDKTNMKEAMQRFAELEERATPKEPVRIDNAMGGKVHRLLPLPELREGIFRNGNCKVLLSLWTEIRLGGLICKESSN